MVYHHFFFLNQQFITQCARADRGSYFHNYIQKTHTNMKLKRKEKKREKEKKLIEMYKKYIRKEEKEKEIRKS